MLLHINAQFLLLLDLTKCTVMKVPQSQQQFAGLQRLTMNNRCKYSDIWSTFHFKRYTYNVFALKIVVKAACTAHG